MRENSAAFSVRRLLASVACFAVALAVLRFASQVELESIPRWLVVVIYFAVPFAIGGGIGLLIQHSWECAMLGIVLSVLIYVAKLMFAI